VLTQRVQAQLQRLMICAAAAVCVLLGTRLEAAKGALWQAQEQLAMGNLQC
jgi:hypothetical protein